MFDHFDRAQTAGFARQKLDHIGGKVEGVDILAERLFHAGAQNLYGDFFTRRPEYGLVNLRERCGGNGFGKAGEYFIDRNAQLVFDLAFRNIDRKRGQLVLQHA